MPARPSEHQGGFALIVVLWVVTLLALQVSVFNLTIRDAGSLAGNELAIARGEALTAAGVEIAVARLMEPEAAWRWYPDGSTREARFGGGRLYITITDEASRFDINEADDEVLESLLRPIGRSAGTLTQWFDSNGAFLDPSELVRALGLPNGAVQALAPYLTVHGGDGRINPLIAPRKALQMLPGAEPAEIDRALNLRRRAGVGAYDVAQVLGSVDKWLTTRTGPAYRIEVAVRDDSEPTIGNAEVVVLLGKDSGAPFRVLSWRYEPRASQPEKRD